MSATTRDLPNRPGLFKLIRGCEAELTERRYCSSSPSFPPSKTVHRRTNSVEMPTFACAIVPDELPALDRAGKFGSSGEPDRFFFCDLPVLDQLGGLNG